MTQQNERATVGDLEALQDAVSRGKVLFGVVTIQHDVALRILNSLRSPDATATPTEAASLIRNFEDAVVECVRTGKGSSAYAVSKWVLEDALRFPVEQQPFGWHMENGDAYRFALAADEYAARWYEERGWKLTPVYTAPVQALEQQPRAWEWTTEGKDGKVWRVVTTDPETADRWKSEEEIVGTVTPLYAVQQPSNDGKGESDADV